MISALLGPLWGESTCQRASDVELWCFLWFSLNRLMDTQSNNRIFETPWRSYDIIVTVYVMFRCTTNNKQCYWMDIRASVTNYLFRYWHLYSVMSILLACCVIDLLYSRPGCRELCERPYDDVIKWKLFPRYWSFVRGIHRSPVNSPHKGQWRGAWMFSLISIWINGWVNNHEAGDLRRYRGHYDVIVMPDMVSAEVFQHATYWYQMDAE